MDVWEGPRVRLRAFEPEDEETYHAWNRDSGQMRGLDAIPFPRSRAASRRWAEDEAKRGPDGDNVRLVIEHRDGFVVGDLTTDSCDPRAGTFSYGITIRREHRGNGYAAEAIRLALRHFFHERRYQKATVSVYAFNEASIRLHEKLGFTREGRLRRMKFTGGEHHDALIFGLLREEFERDADT